MTASVTLATSAQLALVEELLRRAGLPVEGLADQFPGGYVVVQRAGAVVACAGLEVYGTCGLLRSVAVQPELRREGLGRALVAKLLDRARELRLEAVYLLTTTATDYFPRLGFRPVARAAVPEALARAPELANICPSSATVFVFPL
jgi:amino-acid N-acetyltransferase